MLDLNTDGPVNGPLDPHRQEFQRLAAALAHRPQPDERAILAGALLTTVGHVLRRSQLAGDVVLGAAQEALAAVQRDDVQAWLGRASAAGLASVLRRAVDAAFEVALDDTDEERSQHREAALEGLAERERLAASLAGLGAWEQRYPAALDDRARRRREALNDEAKRIDQTLKASASALAALQDERRAERDQLDATCRDECWWYCRHVDDDALLGLLTGTSVDVPGLDPRVRSTMQTLENPPRRHLTADELWDYDLGLLDEAKASWIRHRAADCPDWRRDLRALREGEEAIAQEVSGAAPASSSRRKRPAPCSPSPRPPMASSRDASSAASSSSSAPPAAARASPPCASTSPSPRARRCRWSCGCGSERPAARLSASPPPLSRFVGRGAPAAERPQAVGGFRAPPLHGAGEGVGG